MYSSSDKRRGGINKNMEGSFHVLKQVFLFGLDTVELDLCGLEEE